MIVFFDVDGVLIDGWHSKSALRKPWDETLEADLGVDRAAFQKLFFQGSDEDKEQSPMFGCTVGHVDLMEALAGVLPRVGYAGNVEDFARYWFEKDSNINRQVFDLVDKIRQSGARLYVATGQEHHRARYLWNELGFSKWFDRIFYSAEIGHLKNDVRFFQAINRALGIDGSMKPLYFDDQPEIVALARSAGWEGAAFNSVGDIQNHPRLRHLWN